MSRGGGARAATQGAHHGLCVAITDVVTTEQEGSIVMYHHRAGPITDIYAVTIKARVDGQLIKLHYKESETVHEGDLLVEIDPRPYEVQLEQAEGQQRKDQATLDNARTDLERYRTLWAQNAIPHQQLATQKP